MANFSSFPDVFSWLQNHIQLIKSNSNNNNNNNHNNSINLCPSSNSPNSSQPSLKLSINISNNSYISLSIFADYNLPISLWTSKKTPLKNDDDTSYVLLCNLIEDVLKYSSHKCPSSSPPLTNKLPKPYNSSQSGLKQIFNFSFLSLAFIICIYEAPTDLRATCLSTLKDQFSCPQSRGVSRDLMRLLGSNVEEQWMRSMNLAITNWISELRAANAVLRTPSPLFSYSFSTLGLWKVQLYCPVIAMSVEKSGGSLGDDQRLLFSLSYHQLEGVIQMNYRVDVQEKWIEVMVNTDNIRCDVVKLLTDTLLNERGAGNSEKHFPSRIAIQITPMMQSNVISISVSKSSQNHPAEMGHEKGIEASFEPPTAIGLHFSAGESITTTLKPWNFEQSVYGNTANLNWFLHDSVDGREVFSSKPSKFALVNPKAWFKNRYSNVRRPFTRQGGVIFAGDEYGESVSWKVDKSNSMGNGGGVMEWEIKGWIWVTYWPNKHRTFYTETRRLEFREVVHISLV